MNSVSILGCGWLGMAVAKDLIAHGYQVKGSTTQEQKLETLRAAGIEPYLIHFDPSLKARNAAAFFGSEILIVTIPPRRKSGQTDAYLYQLDTVINLLPASVQKIIFISSTSVYAEQNATVTEQDADPTSYLFQAEQKFMSNKKFKTTILRFGGLFGPGRDPGNFLSGKHDVKGGDNPVNIIHQADCIAIIREIIQKDFWGEIFNACSDQHPTKREFYTKASVALNLKPPQFADAAKSPYKIVSSDKLKQMLPYRFMY